MLEDSKIIDLFFRRSEKAIAALAEKYEKLCMKVAFGILNNLEDSEECVNDAYMGAWDTIPPKEPNPLKAYILKLTRNQALNRYDYNSAKKRNSTCTQCIDELYSVSSDGITPEMSAELREITECIDEYLQTMDEANRLIFLRRYWFTDTYEELSELTGIKVSTLKVKTMRMRDGLKEFLQKKGVAV